MEKIDTNSKIGLVVVGALLTFFAGWVTHIYVCFTTAAWGFLIAGALFFPIGIIHGIFSWF